MDTAHQPASDGEHLDSRKRLAAANRAALIELATQRFATEGYAQTSMRDLERDGPVTLAAIYSHFHNKADLLVAAINQRIVEDLEDVPDEVRRGDLVERLSNNARTYPERRALRALLVQAAAAAQTDPLAKARVRDAQRAQHRLPREPRTHRPRPRRRHRHRHPLQLGRRARPRHPRSL